MRVSIACAEGASKASYAHWRCVIPGYRIYSCPDLNELWYIAADGERNLNSGLMRLLVIVKGESLADFASRIADDRICVRVVRSGPIKNFDAQRPLLE
jgi:hypothetical protein